MSEERNVITIDRHQAWIEEPYVLACQLNGEVTADNLRRMREMLDLIGEGRSPIIILQDLSNAGGFAAAARKSLMDDKRTLRVKTVISIGANFQMRVIMAMLMKALKLVSPNVPLVFFAQDEAEGRQILARERVRILQATS